MGPLYSYNVLVVFAKSWIFFNSIETGNFRSYSFESTKHLNSYFEMTNAKFNYNAKFKYTCGFFLSFDFFIFIKLTEV